jgi:hypothetical protein
MNSFNKFTIFIAIFAQISSTWSQPLNLGSAANFSVFTGVGAFTNTGNSTIMGDLGTDNGSFTGFPPGQYFGQLHVQDAVSTQAAGDVNLLYNYISSLSGSTIGVVMGSGQVLTPGVYDTGAAATLDGNLILDGLNMTDPLFIIRVGGAFSTSGAATVTLINGASSCNVFWQIGGAFTISGISDFKGTAVVNGAANLEGVATIEGRVLVTNGAINMASNFVSICELVLPIELISFDATLNKSQNSVTLNWQTASEINSSHFMIEKSMDGTIFKEEAKVPAKGNSHSLTQYSFVDGYSLTDITYYRLKQYDLDGSFSYSSIRSINLNTPIPDVKIFPNPFSNAFYVEYTTADGHDDIIFELFNYDGKVLHISKLIQSTTVIENLTLQPGHYYYILKNSSAIIKSGHLISY